VLIGKKPEAPLFAAAAGELAAEIKALSGMRASFVYKLPVAQDLLARILRELTQGSDYGAKAAEK
jgi:xanthine dehydrogenase iron-sulfur cluster and FAD-binding subunit A